MCSVGQGTGGRSDAESVEIAEPGGGVGGGGDRGFFVCWGKSRGRGEAGRRPEWEGSRDGSDGTWDGRLRPSGLSLGVWILLGSLE